MFPEHVDCSFDNHAKTLLPEILFLLKKSDIKVPDLTSEPNILGKNCEHFLLNVLKLFLRPIMFSKEKTKKVFCDPVIHFWLSYLISSVRRRIDFYS